MTAPSIEMDGRFHIRPIERLNLSLSVLAVALALWIASPRLALGLATGALLGTANLHLLRSTSARFFEGQLGGGAVWVALFFLRFAALGVAIWFALRSGIDPLGFVGGLLLSIPALFVGAWRMRPPADENAPALPPDDPEWDRWDPWRARESDVEEDAP